jgi:hypothetical protein
VSFSRRFGYGEPRSGERIREDAPEPVRVGFLQIFEERLQPHGLRTVACRALRKRANEGNWSAYPNVWSEVEELVHEAPWYKFYDVVEAAIAANESNRIEVIEELNELFDEESLAWHIVDGKVTLRTGEVTDAILDQGVADLEEVGRNAAAHELRGALGAVSKRPIPDTRDAVRRALGALEAVSRDITGERSATLGQILKRSSSPLPPTLNEAFSKIWGYSSEVARHVDETKEPTVEEAVLVVGFAAAAIAYLARKT